MAEPYRSETADFSFVRNNTLVREPAQGESLAARAASGWRADEIAAKALSAEILRILVHIHPRPHRGIAPGRVLLRREGGAALAHVDESDDARSVAPDYVAPEQFRGGATARSDLYALGATMIFALTGAAPGELPQRKLAIDFRSRVKLSGPFADWLETMIAPAPEDRFVDAAGALAALTAGKRKGRGNARVIALALGLVAVVGAGVAVAVFEVRDARRRADLASENRRRTSTGQLIPIQPLPVAPSFGTSELASLRNIEAFNAPVHALAFSRDAKTLFSGSLDGVVKAWNVADGSQLRVFTGHTGRVSSLAVSEDDKTLVSAGDTSVRIWDVATATTLRTIPNVDARQPTQVLLARDGATIMTTGFDGNAKLWDAKTGELRRTFAHSPGKGRLFALATTADESLVFTGGDDRMVKVWNRASGALDRTISGHQAGVNAIAVAGDGQTIVTASDDRTVRAWNARSGASLHVWHQFVDEVWHVGVVPKSSLVVSGGATNSLRVGELVSWRSQGRVGADTRTMALAFAPSGEILASGHQSGIVTLWSVGGRDRHTKVPRATNLAAPKKAATSAEDAQYLECKDALDGWSGTALEPIEAKLQAILAKNPKYALAYVGLARVETDRGFHSGDNYDKARLEAAQRLIDKAEALAPRHAPILVGRARVLWLQRKREDALRVAKEAEVLAPDDIDVNVLLARFAADRHDWTEAEKRATYVIEHATTAGLVGRAYGTLEDVYFERGDRAAGKQAHELHIELAPRDAWAKGAYAKFLSRHGDYDAAIAMAKQAIATRDYPIGHDILANAHARKGATLLWGGNASAAKVELDAALVENPRDHIALYARGAYYRQLAYDTGSLDHARESKKAFDATLAADPSYRVAKDALAEHPKLLEAIRR